MDNTIVLGIISSVVVPALGGVIWIVKHLVTHFLHELEAARTERQTRCEQHAAVEMDMTIAMRDTTEVLRELKGGMEKVCARLDINGKKVKV